MPTVGHAPARAFAATRPQRQIRTFSGGLWLHIYANSRLGAELICGSWPAHFACSWCSVRGVGLLGFGGVGSALEECAQSKHRAHLLEELISEQSSEPADGCGAEEIGI